MMRLLILGGAIVAVLLCAIALLSAVVSGFSAPSWVLPAGCTAGFGSYLLFLATGAR